MSPWRPVIAGVVVEVEVEVEVEFEPPPHENIKNIKINKKVILFIVPPKKTPHYLRDFFIILTTCTNLFSLYYLCLSRAFQF